MPYTRRQPDRRGPTIVTDDSTGESITLVHDEIALFYELGNLGDLGMFEAARIAAAYGPYRHKRRATAD